MEGKEICKVFQRHQFGGWRHKQVLGQWLDTRVCKHCGKTETRRIKS
jgi:hypothetical protein